MMSEEHIATVAEEPMHYDHQLHFQVMDKVISFFDGALAEVVADNFGCICIKIDFDAQWDGIAKTARFIYNGAWKDVVLNSDDMCICPSEVLKKGRFFLGVYGANLKSTTPIAISVKESILSESGEELPEDPTPDVYNQIMTLMAETSESAKVAAQAAWDAAQKVDDAVNALNGAKKELEEGGFITAIEEKNKGRILSFWVGTTAEYNALPEPPKDCYVILEDDDTLSKLNKVLFDGKPYGDEFQDWMPGREYCLCGIDRENYVFSDDFHALIRSYDRIAMDIMIKSYDHIYNVWKKSYQTVMLHKEVLDTDDYDNVVFRGSYVRDHFSEAKPEVSEAFIINIKLGLNSDPDEGEYEVYMFSPTVTSYFMNENIDDDFTLSEGEMQIIRIIGLS